MERATISAMLINSLQMIVSGLNPKSLQRGLLSVPHTGSDIHTMYTTVEVRDETTP